MFNLNEDKSVIFPSSVSVFRNVAAFDNRNSNNGKEIVHILEQKPPSMLWQHHVNISFPFSMNV